METLVHFQVKKNFIVLQFYSYSSTATERPCNTASL